jgi:hypothetical protein
MKSPRVQYVLIKMQNKFKLPFKIKNVYSYICVYYDHLMIFDQLKVKYTIN